MKKYKILVDGNSIDPEILGGFTFLIFVTFDDVGDYNVDSITCDLPLPVKLKDHPWRNQIVVFIRDVIDNDLLSGYDVVEIE